jgi:DHA3 family macrolide efflux protein-like MFS transporter
LVGSRIAQFALVWWLTDQTGSATVLATASLVALIPEILVAPIAGACVDRWSRRSIMLLADGLVALASLWLAYLFWAGATQVWHIYVLMLVRALGSSFHWPAMQASTSLMVPEKHLTRVAGLNQTVNGGLNVAAPPLGALLLGWLPPQGVMLIDVGTAALAIAPLFFVPIPHPQRGGTDEATVRPGIWSDIREGLRYVKGWPGLRALIGIAMVVKVALTPAFSLLPLLVRERFAGGAAQLSLFESIAGGGIVIGGLLLSAWGGFRRRICTTLLGIGTLGLGFLVLAMTPGSWLWLGLTCVFVVGFVIPLVDGPIMAILQSTVAPEIQGRVFTLMNSLVWMTSPLGLSIAGPVSDWLGLSAWYLTAGCLCIAAGVLGLFVPAVLGIEDNHKGYGITDKKALSRGTAPAAPGKGVS